MNFTALVILLQTDNILGAIFQKKIDSFGFDFAYQGKDEDTGMPSDKVPEFEFNRAANFMVQRREKFWCLEIFENLLNYFILILIFLVFTATPIIFLSMYVLIPVHNDK